MKVLKEFREFINKGNVVDLAVAVVIGGAFGKIVSALVADMVMPLVNAVIPEGDWRKWEVSPLHFRVGDFLGTLVDFTIVAFVVFVIMVKIVGTVNRKAAGPETKQCQECLETVPKAARRCRACTSVFAALALMLLAGSASAQGNPTFTYGKMEEAKAGAPPPPPVEWKVQAKGILSMTTGNSQTTNGGLALAASRRESANKFSLDAAISYGKSNVLTPQIGPDPNNMAMMAVTGIGRTEVTTTNNWLTKARYDRFFTANNSGYASGQAAADKVAGKAFFGGGQVGYSRQLVKNDLHLLVSELGYDYSYESYVDQPGRTLDPVSIHSARLFVGETLKLTPASGITASVEALFNLNKEAKALDASSGTVPAAVGVSAFHDTRLVGKLGVTTTLFGRLSVGLGFTLRYDQNPPPRPIPPLPAGTPAGTTYSSTFQPFSDRADTLTEATLIYTFI